MEYFLLLRFVMVFNSNPKWFKEKWSDWIFCSYLRLPLDLHSIYYNTLVHRISRSVRVSSWRLYTDYNRIWHETGWELIHTLPGENKPLIGEINQVIAVLSLLTAQAGGLYWENNTKLFVLILITPLTTFLTQLCFYWNTIIDIIFTSLCKNLVKLTWVLAEAFQCHGHHFQCLTAYGIEKLLLKLK